MARRTWAPILLVTVASTSNDSCSLRQPCLRSLHEPCAHSDARFAHEQPLPATHPSRAPCAACFGLGGGGAPPPPNNGTAAAPPPPPLSLQLLCQLHVPKTGSWFAETLARSACPGLFARDGGVYADLVRRQANISKEDSRSLLSTAGSESSLPSAAAGAN